MKRTGYAAMAMMLTGTLMLGGCATDEDITIEPALEDVAEPVFVNGGLTTSVDASVEEVVMAGVLALNDLNMVGARGDVTNGEGAVLATTPTNERIYLDISRLGDERSRFSVSIGTFGDEELSRRIYERTLYYLQQQDVADTPAQVPYHIVEPDVEQPVDDPIVP